MKPYPEALMEASQDVLNEHLIGIMGQSCLPGWDDQRCLDHIKNLKSFGIGVVTPSPGSAGPLCMCRGPAKLVNTGYTEAICIGQRGLHTLWGGAPLPMHCVPLLPYCYPTLDSIPNSTTAQQYIITNYK